MFCLCNFKVIEFGNLLNCSFLLLLMLRVVKIFFKLVLFNVMFIFFNFVMKVFCLIVLCLLESILNKFIICRLLLWVNCMKVFNGEIFLGF